MQAPAFTEDDSPSFRRSFERWRATLSSFSPTSSLRCDARTAWAEESTPSGTVGEGKTQAELDREANDCKRCQKWRDELTRDSPIVRFLLTHLSLLPPPPDAPPVQLEGSQTPHLPLPITCAPCPPTMAGGYASGLGVLLCQNRFMSRKHMEDALSHELIHAWDERRFKPKGRWGEDLRAHACTEIRAENLSGDCRFGREFTRRNWAFTKQHQACVRRRAILSVTANPNCKSAEEAERVVNEVFDSCFPDTRPFDEIY